MKFFIRLICLMSSISFSYSQEIAIVLKAEIERSISHPNYYVAEFISKNGGHLVYRELMHPSRMGGEIIGVNGKRDYGLITASIKQVIKSTEALGRDMNGDAVQIGSTLHTRIQTGRRGKYVDGYVLRNFKNGTSLISFGDSDFVKLALDAGISEAIKRFGYFSLRIVDQSRSVVIHI
jgi:hypothetical protein